TTTMKRLPGLALVLTWALSTTGAGAAQDPTPAAAATPPPAAAPTPAAAIEFFAPHGSVKQIRQATARFTTPMTALGDPRLSDPFDIACPAPGKGRWADGRNWVYDFDADLPA